MNFVAHYLIKFRKGCLDIRFNKENADSAGKSSEKDPAEERKFKTEDIEFLLIGHFFGKFKGTFGADSGIFRKDIGNHVILIGFDYSGDEEKKAPEEDFKVHQEYGFNYVKIVSAFEDPENAFDFGTGNAVFHKEAVHSNEDRIADEDVEKEGKKNEKGNRKGDEGRNFFVSVKGVFKFRVFGNYGKNVSRAGR